MFSTLLFFQFGDFSKTLYEELRHLLLCPYFPQVKVPLKCSKSIIRLYLFFFFFLIVEQFLKKMIAILSHSLIFCGFHIYLDSVYAGIKCYLELPLSCSLHCKRLFSWGIHTKKRCFPCKMERYQISPLQIPKSIVFNVSTSYMVVGSLHSVGVCPLIFQHTPFS